MLMNNMQILSNIKKIWVEADSHITTLIININIVNNNNNIMV